jgi:hypothetical protein
MFKLLRKVIEYLKEEYYIQNSFKYDKCVIVLSKYY